MSKSGCANANRVLRLARHLCLVVRKLSKLRYNAIGYHGCPEERAQAVEDGGVEAWKFSKGWLGQGIYFWDNDRSTGDWWAKKHYSDEGPAVISARIDLTDGLDLTNVFGQNALKKLRGMADKNSATKAELKALREQDLSPDGALIHLAKQQFEERYDTQFPCVRAPVHMKPSHDTMKRVSGTELITGFRMVILVFDRSIISEYEVHHVD